MYTNPKCGLNEKQIQERINNHQINIDDHHITKSYKEILSAHLFTLFNLINAILAAFIIFIGSYKNLLFLGVVFSNLFIGVFQEIRSKRILDKLALIHASKVKVLRNSKWLEINIEELVIDDIIKLNAGNQVSADCEIIEGSVEVNESLLTGESDLLLKKVKDSLYSGSYIISGEAICQVMHVGKDNYIAKITNEVKVLKKHPSSLRDAINFIIKYCGILLIPMGIALFIKQFVIAHISFNETIISTVAALVGMIPEGLVLLTSIALAVGSIKLARKNTLVQELYCIETLARVDMLCLDKTGTITEGNMSVQQIIINNSNLPIDNILYSFLQIEKSKNATSLALQNYLPSSCSALEIMDSLPFNSERKYSYINTSEYGNFYLGAYEYIETKQDDKLEKQMNDLASLGYRIITLVHQKVVIAIVILEDKIRDEAYDTIAYFKKQGVDMKIISGDDPKTVSAIALRAGFSNYDKYVDTSKINEEDLDDLLKEKVIFGRVTPNIKKAMIKALKKQGHCVAMIGDGVNDVMALKEADCSITLSQGSDAAKNIANLVLLDNNFANMPHIVNEGRRVINNIQRSASLFLVKTAFSMLISILTLFVLTQYPFEPIQLTLISSLTIGIPSFFLALEPNYDKVKGNFLITVLSNALPAAICVVLVIIYTHILGYIYHYNFDIISTMGVYLCAACDFIVLYRVCMPFNKLRFILCILLTITFLIAIIFFPSFFSLYHLNLSQIIQITIGIAVIFPIMDLSYRIKRYLMKKLNNQ